VAEPSLPPGAFPPPPPPVPSAELIAQAFKVSPEAAIAFFRSLGIDIRWDWRIDAANARDLGFYVSKITEREVLAAIKAEVARALELGITRQQFRSFLRGRLAQLGWLGAQEVISPDGEIAVVDVSTPHRMDVIFRTNTQTAYNAGRYKEQIAIAGVAPYWQYLAVLDSRTRPGHAEMSGKVFLATDPIWQVIYPPCGFNCRCRVRTMTRATFEASGFTLEEGATFALPDGFPDAGFGFNPANMGALLGELSASAARAGQRAQEFYR